MSFKRKDIITFDDDKRVLVLDALVHDGIEYLYVNELLENDELSDNYRILSANYNDGTLESVENNEILKILIDLFNDSLKKYDN